MSGNVIHANAGTIVIIITTLIILVHYLQKKPQGIFKKLFNILMLMIYHLLLNDWLIDNGVEEFICKGNIPQRFYGNTH